MIELFTIDTPEVHLIWRQKDKKTVEFQAEPLKIMSRSHISSPTLKLTQNKIPKLLEETTYQIYLKGKDCKIELLHTFPFELHTEDNSQLIYGDINFGSQTGLSLFTILANGTPIFDFELHIWPSKMEAVEDYQQMLSELQEFYASHLYEYLKPVYQEGMSQFSLNQTPLEWLLLMKQNLEQLTTALEYLHRQPLHDLSYREEEVYPHKIKANKIKANIVVHQKIKQAEKVIVQSLVSTTDTYENSWLKFQLSLIQDQLLTVKQTLLAQYKIPALKTEFEQIENKLNASFKLIPPCRDIQNFPEGFSSLKLLMKPGYREIYQFLIRLKQGLELGQDTFQLHFKDIHLLYERWCLITLFKSLNNIAEAPLTLTKALAFSQTYEQSFEFAYGSKRITLTYQPNFEHTALPLQQRPDFLLSVKIGSHPPYHFILDAKYRLDSSEAYSKQFGSSGPPKEALNTLHRYRDAILNPAKEHIIVQALALFPSKSEPLYTETALWQSIFKTGVGAIPLLPGSTTYLEQWLNWLLEQNEWSISQSTIPHQSQKSQVKLQKMESEIVLVGVLKEGYEREHLNWITQEHRYFIPLTKKQQRQHKVQWVALYEPETLHPEQGAILKYAQVKALEIVKRTDISTPWPTARPNQLYLLYHLEPLQNLTHPILNIRQRFSKNRWTTRLALEKATQIKELHLETIQEWELYDYLKAHQIPFQLKALPVQSLKKQSLKGRVQFLIGESITIHTSSKGYLMGNLFFDNKTKLIEGIKNALNNSQS